MLPIVGHNQFNDLSNVKNVSLFTLRISNSVFQRRLQVKRITWAHHAVYTEATD